MLQKLHSLGGMLILAGAAVLWTAGSGWAAGPGGHGGGGHGGGGHGGGAHFSGGHMGGYHGGGYHGGYGGGYHPSYGYGNAYRGSYGHYGYGRYGSYYPYFGYTAPYSLYSYDAYTAPSNLYSYDGSYPNYGYSPSPYSYLPPTTSTSGYEPSSSDAYHLATAEVDNRVHLRVTVPADAKIWMDDTQTTSTGPVRAFDSPPLTPGKRYTYEVRARWTENGHEVTQTQSIPVTAGAEIDVRFPLSSGNAKQQAAGN
jgi:uncharacterized protein (TIGR03000 family)